MKSIIRVESRRILKKEVFLIFLAVVASGRENLKHGKENAVSRSIEDAIVIRRGQEEAVFVEETNIEKLVALNYQDKTAEALSDAEINFFSRIV